MIFIKYKFLRFVSKLLPVLMHFFDHDYTNIRNYLKLTPLRSIFLRNDYILSFKISRKLFQSSSVNELFAEWPLSYNLHNPRPLPPNDSKLNYINVSTIPRLQHLWNLLPQVIRDSSTLTIFRAKIDEYITRKTYYYVKHHAKNKCHPFLPYGRDGNYEQHRCKLSLTTHRRRL